MHKIPRGGGPNMCVNDDNLNKKPKNYNNEASQVKNSIEPKYRSMADNYDPIIQTPDINRYLENKNSSLNNLANTDNMVNDIKKIQNNAEEIQKGRLIPNIQKS